MGVTTRNGFEAMAARCTDHLSAAQPIGKNIHMAPWWKAVWERASCWTRALLQMGIRSKSISLWIGDDDMTKACDDLLIKWETVRRKLLNSGADLSKIKIVMEKGSLPSYVTHRIIEDLKNGT